MIEYLSAVPAYGRDYKSKAEVLAAWNEGKDFQIMPSGQYVNKNDKPANVTLNIRYKRQSMVCVVK